MLISDSGDMPAKASSEEVPPADVPLGDRLGEIQYNSYSTSGNISQIAKDQLSILKDEFLRFLKKQLKQAMIFRSLNKSSMR